MLGAGSMSTFYAVPLISPHKSGFVLTPFKDARSACPVDTSNSDSFDIQVHAEYNATPASKTYMSTTDAVPMWEYFGGGGFFRGLVDGNRLTFAYYKSGSDATLGDYGQTMGTSLERAVMIANNDVTLMNRGKYHFKIEVTSNFFQGYNLNLGAIYYWNTTGPTIPLYRAFSSYLTGNDSSPKTFDYWCGELCKPFAAGVGMWAPVNSGDSFDVRFRGYRDGTTANF